MIKDAERIMTQLTRDKIRLNEMLFGFALGRSIIDIVFRDRQLQEKYLAKKELLYLAFLDLEKIFSKTSHPMTWWSLRMLDGWLVKAVQALYRDVVSKVIINYEYSNEFSIQV